MLNSSIIFLWPGVSTGSISKFGLLMHLGACWDIQCNTMVPQGCLFPSSVAWSRCSSTVNGFVGCFICWKLCCSINLSNTAQGWTENIVQKSMQISGELFWEFWMVLINLVRLLVWIYSQLGRCYSGVTPEWQTDEQTIGMMSDCDTTCLWFLHSHMFGQ